MTAETSTAPGRHGLGLLGARVDGLPLDLDAVLLKGLLEHAFFLHDHVLKVERALHVDDRHLFGHGGEGGRGKGAADGGGKKLLHHFQDFLL